MFMSVCRSEARLLPAALCFIVPVIYQRRLLSVWWHLQKSWWTVSGETWSVQRGTLAIHEATLFVSFHPWCHLEFWPETDFVDTPDVFDWPGCSQQRRASCQWTLRLSVMMQRMSHCRIIDLEGLRRGNKYWAASHMVQPGNDHGGGLCSWHSCHNCRHSAFV